MFHKNAGDLANSAVSDRSCELIPISAAALQGVEPAEELGPLGELVWLPLRELLIDRRYQRDSSKETSRNLVRKIVENFRWSRFQPLIVAHVATGYAVVDGQHRAISACTHGGIDKVPCWLIIEPQTRGQAQTFVGVNRDRASISALQIHRAGLAAGDPDAVQVDRVCTSAGVTIVFNLKGSQHTLPPKTTMAVGTIRQLIFKYGEAPVRAGLAALVSAYPTTPGQLRGQVITAVVSIFAKHKAVDSERLARVLADTDCEDLLDAAMKVRKLMGGSTESGMAAALVRTYDKGLSGSGRLGGPPEA